MQTTGKHVPIEGIEDTAVKAAIRALTNMLRGATLERAGALAARPTDLTNAQTGATFYATDYRRLFRWNGSTWEDAYGAPPRRMVIWFDDGPVPQTGWSPCDGRTVSISQTDGSEMRYQTPIVDPLNGMNPWVRL